MRAIAVLAVIGFHAFPLWVTGGFIGVDIFFVISGYLISTIILENLARGSFSLAEFYRRRVRRIFPALLLVLVVTLAVGYALLFTHEFAPLGKHVAAGAGFVANLIFWQESGYFDVAADTKPLLHLWSLGIEEQFYILWPVLLWAGWKFRINLLAVIAVLAVASFALNAMQIGSASVATFYSPLTRFWELLLGAGLAYMALHKPQVLARVQVGNGNIAAFLGVGCLVAGLALITKQSAFPGYWALLPTLGAVALIAAGPRAWFNRVILANRVLVWVGLISFPLYLWHWPLLSFATIVENTVPPLFTRVGLVLLSVVLAWLTYRFIEQPVRQQRTGKWTVSVLVVLVFAVGVCGLAAYKAVITPRNDTPDIQRVVAAAGDWEHPKHLTNLSIPGEELFFFLKGSKAITFMFGDSHVEQYSPRIVALHDRKLADMHTVYWATLGGCPPIEHVYEDKLLSCKKMREDALKFIERPEVKVVVVGGCWNCYFVEQTSTAKDAPRDHDYYFQKDGRRERFRGGRGKKFALAELEAMLTRLAKTKKVYLTLDNPSVLAFNPSTYVTPGTRFSGRIREVNPMLELPKVQRELNDELIAIAKRAKVEVINPVAHLCKDNLCPVVMPDGQFIHKDVNHLRPFYVREHIPYLDKTVVPQR